jgi:hypothetical protein
VQGQLRNSTTHPTAPPGADGGGRSDGSRGLAARARNQCLLREVNDRIAELAERNETGVSLLVCECSDLSCADALEISAAEYARIRTDESYFVVLPGHEQPESDRVVDRNGRFVVVANCEPEAAEAGSSEGRRAGH